jgi:NAD(P)-dependent dehydrogenase (short-subunit alcohol dehydrogenase family)
VNLSFENKVALVTGAASGMGLATAKAFAVAGAAVALADVNEAALRSAADNLVAAGHKAIGIRCDVADEAEVAAMVEQTVSTFGRTAHRWVVSWDCLAGRPTTRPSTA